ncbi:Single-stranded DNA-binding protein [Bacteroides pyogenes]|uniref:single-stranded DNA-binding protein n=1 Tax=Bacteroides pyogenes TaxID=310300 RepID=UPI001BAB5C56|nr:single-stranded DNA-binding protein [Bacteroides pyogenes]MBR8721144.1 Single-stranded DNA-binding protein [Bacteroides pyogenes]MBR8724864.1 Single-stranded DNA-binding protein [Bacteroides pyogenes]MBR8738357.1 Single-stranded DNA-binding protein [Bacteroides pyogenes]MBR8754030.1 Single-stranded DNA-binding protein [Bacteroides pyogenes]MBR8788042.1 Single-stranded DNA-binding protein [Bacteroides pyogenes]
MSVNKVILLGNVGQDPRVKYFDTGSAVATFPLATTDRAYTLSNGTQIPERTEWHNIVVSNRLAEVVDKYVHKGDKLYLEGKIRTRSYTDQSGATRYITEVYADNMEMLTPKGASTGASAAAPASSQTGQGSPAQQGQAQYSQGYSSQGQPLQGQSSQGYSSQAQSSQTQQGQTQPSQGQSPQGQQGPMQSSQGQPAEDNPADDLPF